MLTSVMEQLAAVIEVGLKGTITRDNLLLYSPYANHVVRIEKLPLIAIYDSGFKIEESSLGAGVADSNEELREAFSGDGKKTVFRLQKRLLKPSIRVEFPAGTILKAPDDFVIDYLDNSVIFRLPPAKGGNNILIRYATARSVGETRSLRITIKCHIDVWAQDMKMCDSILFETMKAILFSAERMAANGIRIIPIEGVNTTENNENDSGGMIFGRRLVYLVEVDARVEHTVPPIEKIDILNRAEEPIR